MVLEIELCPHVQEASVLPGLVPTFIVDKGPREAG